MKRNFYVVVMTALFFTSIQAMKKVNTISGGLNGLNGPEIAKALVASKSVRHIKTQEEVKLRASTWFEQLKTHEIQRNALKLNDFDQVGLKDFISNINDDMARIQSSNRLLDIYQDAEKELQATGSAKNSLLYSKYMKHIDQANEILAESLKCTTPSCFCALCDQLLEKHIKKVRYIRKHSLHAEFGLHDKIKQSDVTQELVLACRWYFHVDLTYAELEKRLVSLLRICNETQASGCCAQLPCSIS